jgi:hypothetical protein
MTRTTRRDLVKLSAAATLAAGATAARAAARPARHKHGRLPIAYPLGLFTRDKANPIHKPAPSRGSRSSSSTPQRSSATA